MTLRTRLALRLCAVIILTLLLFSAGVYLVVTRAARSPGGAARGCGGGRGRGRPPAAAGGHAIALTERMGGTLTVTSTLGAGSVFTLSLPLAPTPALLATG